MELTEALAQAQRGQIGVLLHDAVTRVVAGGRTRAEAIAEVAEQTGRSVGSVSEAFYRVERRGRSTRRARGARKPAAARPAARRSGDAPAAAALGALEQAVKELGALIRSQERELTRLRPKAAMIQELRRALDPPTRTTRRRRPGVRAASEPERAVPNGQAPDGDPGEAGPVPAAGDDGLPRAGGSHDGQGDALSLSNSDHGAEEAGQPPRASEGSG